MASQPVTERNIYVMSHGWAPGMRSVARSSEEFLRVWDPEASTAEGARFDSWYPKLADPTAVACLDRINSLLARERFGVDQGEDASDDDADSV